MLGNPDEYFDAHCPSRSPINTGTVMADNTEVVARHLNNIAGFHCGHTPGSSNDVHAHPGENVKMFMFGSLAEPNRAEFLETIKRAATSTALDHEIGDTNLILTISGGAPGQRYEYQLKVSADGLSESSFKDELRNIEPQTSRGDVGRQMAAEVFRAAMEGVLELPRVAEAIEPDSLVMTLSLQSGDVAKLVQRAVFEEDSAAAPSLGPDAVELEVRKGLSVSRAATPTGLSTVLTKLAAIQEKIGQP
jgi:hypothetical protein